MGRKLNDGPNGYGLRRPWLGLRVPMVGGTKTWRPSLCCLRLWRTATDRDTRTGSRRGFHRLEHLQHAATGHALCTRAPASHDKAVVNRVPHPFSSSCGASNPSGLTSALLTDRIGGALRRSGYWTERPESKSLRPSVSPSLCLSVSLSLCFSVYWTSILMMSLILSPSISAANTCMY